MFLVWYIHELKTIYDKVGLLLHFRKTVGNLSIHAANMHSINQLDEFLCSKIQKLCREISSL